MQRPFRNDRLPTNRLWAVPLLSTLVAVLQPLGPLAGQQAQDADGAADEMGVDAAALTAAAPAAWPAN